MSKPQITVSNNTNISDEWYTPLQIINRSQQFYQDSYWLDVASNEIAQTYIKANQYIDREIDALNIHTS